jgi:hypothetical protein
MPIISARQLIERKRGRRIVAVAAILLLATQFGSVLHATGHLVGDGGVSCQICLLTDKPIGAAPQPQPARAVAMFDGPARDGVEAPPRSIAYSLPPVRGPPAHS